MGPSADSAPAQCRLAVESGGCCGDASRIRRAGRYRRNFILESEEKSSEDMKLLGRWERNAVDVSRARLLVGGRAAADGAQHARPGKRRTLGPRRATG